MTSEQQQTGAATLFLRYLFASLYYFAPNINANKPNITLQGKEFVSHSWIFNWKIMKIESSTNW